VAEGLSGRHRMLAMDLRGRGLSEKPASGYSVAHHCRDIVGLMDDLQMETVVVMGHSLGAVIALALAAEHPRRVERLVLFDGGGSLSKEQMVRVFAGIKPALDRLGRIFPSFSDYTARLKEAPFLQPWSRHHESYFRYEVEAVEEGVRSRVRPEHIAEEIFNMKEVEAARLYPKVKCPVLILRATDGMLAKDDILLPEEAVERMVAEIPGARRVDVAGTNHYSILFEPNTSRDGALLDFI
jgi:pimeloyl-ACP methyl ester carboxylesterase